MKKTTSGIRFGAGFSVGVLTSLLVAGSYFPVMTQMMGHVSGRAGRSIGGQLPAIEAVSALPAFAEVLRRLVEAAKGALVAEPDLAGSSGDVVRRNEGGYQVRGGFAGCEQDVPGNFRYSVRQPGSDVVVPGGLVAMCLGSYGVVYSGQSKTPVASIERVNAQEIRAAFEQERAAAFHEEARLPLSLRSKLSDFERSGFDRGHLTPSGDCGTPECREQSNSLANVVPQDPEMNRHSWLVVEKSTRKFVLRSMGNDFVITGPIFSRRVGASGRPAVIGAGRVWVPQQLFKAVFDEHSGRSWVYVMDNDAKARPSAPISYEQFVKTYGVALF